MNCEICGKEKDNLYETVIEGAHLKVCSDCSKLGKRVYSEKKNEMNVSMKADYLKKYDVEPKKKKGKSAMLKSFDRVPVDKFGSKIREAREKRGLTQDEFARLIKEKESLIHAIEAERIEPSEKVAKKIQNSLGIKVIEDLKANENTPFRSKDNEKMTLGHFIKVKKK